MNKVETILNDLIKEMYNESTFRNYESQLRKLHQRNYNNFNDFIIDFNSIIEKCNYCARKKGDMHSEREIKNFFYNSVDFNTKKALIREGIDNVTEAIKFITKLEALKEECKYNDKEKIIQTREYNRSFSRKINKWCSYHRSTTNSNSECIRQNDKRNNEAEHQHKN